MSENPFTDGQQFSSARLNSMYNAHQNNGVLTGLDGTVGTNSFEVDVSAGEVFLNDSVVSTAATTVTHTTSDVEDRIDLITVDATGAVSVTTGSPATTSGQPVAPDIPTDEVLGLLVYVRGGSAEILTGDILNDYRTTLEETPPELISPQGAGSGLDADTADNATTADALNGNNVNTVEGRTGNVNLYTPRRNLSGDVLFGAQIESASTTTNQTFELLTEVLSYTVNTSNVAFIDVFATYDYEDYNVTAGVVEARLYINGNKVGSSGVEGSGSVSGSDKIDVTNQSSLTISIEGEFVNSSGTVTSVNSDSNRNEFFADQLI